MSILNKKATIVELTGSTWRATVSDRGATDGTANLYGTTPKWVTTSKRLVDPEVLRKPKAILAKARNYLRGESPGEADGKFIPGGLPPWDGKGGYILPNALNETVVRNLGAFQSAFEDAVQELAAVLPAAIDAARTENGQLFSDNDYGTVEELLSRYTFGTKFTTIPDAGDVRVEASKAFVEALKGSLEEQSKRKLHEVTSHAVKTVVDVATHLASALSGYSEEPGKRGASPFRDSTVDKVRDLVGILPALNVTGDAKIEQARQDLLLAVGNRSAKELRADAEDRETVAKNLTAVADNLTNIFGSD